MSAGRKRVRVQGFEIPAGEIIGLIRWFPLEGEWQHELVTGALHGLTADGRIELINGDELRAYDADTWAVCSAVPEPLRGLAS
ncbi:hypothetical protein [Curtobacterium sp. 18060]|uniref:hypothetical protein n=1 Tax=Curtobacterium sp. 18060 TaxID=2681408 RepID=UPI001358855F|nr:hypothetical protein [Curtobacterium sp. 18060]